MDSLDAVVAQVQALSGSPDDVAHLNTVLSVQSMEELLSKTSSRLGPSLARLDGSRHSLGYLYLLEAQVSSPSMRDQSSHVMASVISFIEVCSAEQIRLAPEKFASLCSKLREHAVSCKEYSRAILPLQNAIRKIQPSKEHLTPQHADMAQLCLLAKCYSSALPVLDEDIFEVEPKKTALQLRDFLLYCYYGGMIYLGLKQFQRALEFFHHTVSAPATVLNAITVTSYKKFILASLVATGQVAPLPKFTPSVVQRSLKSCCQEYLELAGAYAGGEAEELQRCLTRHTDTFKADSNLGLARQAVASVHKRNIQRLTMTFLTLSLQDIASTVQLAGPKEAELHVLRMIEDGEIFASINQKDGMVRFQEDPEQYNTREMAEKIDVHIQKTIHLARRLATLEEAVACDRTYLSRISMKDRHGRYGDPEDFDLGSQKVFDTI